MPSPLATPRRHIIHSLLIVSMLSHLLSPLVAARGILPPEAGENFASTHRPVPDDQATKANQTMFRPEAVNDDPPEPGNPTVNDSPSSAGGNEDQARSIKQPPQTNLPTQSLRSRLTTWGTPVQISDVSNVSTLFPSVAVKGNRIYAVWVDERFDSNGDVFFTKSLDGGQTWSPGNTRLTPDTISDNVKIFDQSIVVAPDGNTLYVAWVARDFVNQTGTITVSRSDDDGNTWTHQAFPVNISTTGEFNLAVGEGGRLYLGRVPIKGAANSNSNFSYEAHISYSDTGGQSWSNEIQVTNGGFNYEVPIQYSQVVPAGNGVVYLPFRSVSYELSLEKSSDRGQTWSRVNVPSSTVEQMALAAGDAADLYFVWLDSGIIYYLQSGDGGGSWSSTPGQIASIAGTSTSNLALTYAGGGHLVAVWEDNDNIFVAESLDNGQTWAAAQNLGIGKTPNVAADPVSGAIGIVWHYLDGAVNINLVYALGVAGTNPPPFPSDQALSSHECPICSSANRIHSVGGPINTQSGNYNYETADLTIPTAGQPLRFERAYNSQVAEGELVYDRPLGPGWTHSYDLHLTLPHHPGGEPDTVILKAPHGSRMRFSDNGDGTFIPHPGVWAEMTRLGRTYRVTTTNQTVYTFEAPPPQLTLTTPYILAANRTLSDVAYNPVDDEYLVVLQSGSGSDLTALRLDSAGNTLGNEISLSPTASGGGRVVFNPVVNEYFVIWDDHRFGSTAINVYAQRLAADGSLIGGNLGLTAEVFSQQDSQLAYDPLTQTYLVVWHELNSATPNEQVLAMRLPNSGVPFVGFPVNTNGGCPRPGGGDRQWQVSGCLEQSGQQWE